MDMELENNEEQNIKTKKQKLENGKSVEEKRADNLSGVKLGPKSFESSVEMWDYFFKVLHFWPPYVNLNKYEQMVMLELLNKGHPEPEKKIGKGVHAFQVRVHPEWKSKCFFIIRKDETAEDFSFRKCVDQILPLPENLQIKKSQGGKGGRGGGNGGRGGGRRGYGNFRGGRGRGDKPRN